MNLYIGIDGCPAGWFAVTLQDSGDYTTRIFSTIHALWTAVRGDSPEMILIDIPIGLPESGARAADAEARKLLGNRRSSIFGVPTRAAIYASVYAEGTQINKLATGLMFSR